MLNRTLAGICSPTGRKLGLLRASYTSGNWIHGCDDWPKSGGSLVDRQIRRDLYFAKQGWRLLAIGTGSQVCTRMACTVVARASVLPHHVPYSPPSSPRRVRSTIFQETAHRPGALSSRRDHASPAPSPVARSSMKSPDERPTLTRRSRSESSWSG